MKRPAILLILLLVSLASAQTVPYTKFTLDNGMTFILHEDHSAPKVVVNTWFHVGSKDEPERRSGFAHLFEHLMFMGTKRAPGHAFDTLMEGGGGWNNASTTTDRTNFYDVGPSNLLPTLLWLEADRLQDLGNAMTQEKLNLQREVVLNERRETENSPYGNAGIKLPELMYPVGHPYHFDTIGLPEDLNAATVQDVKNFFATYYVPNNATMVIAGDFDSAKVKPIIEKYFGALPRKNDPVHRDAPQPENPAEPLASVGNRQAQFQETGTPLPNPSPLRSFVAQGGGAKTTRLTMVDQVQYPQITFAWHSPAGYQPGDAEMDLTAYTLSNGISSRLYQKLVYQDKIATDVSASQNSEKLGSQFLVTVTAQNGVPLDRVETETREVLADFVKGGPTADELHRQVAQIETANLNALQSIENIADAMNEYEYYYGEPDSFKRDLDRYRNATPESVQQVAASVIGKEPRVVLTVLPQGQKPKGDPLATKPTVGKEATWSPTAPTQMTLSNGVKVFYWQRPVLPLMSLATVFNRGSELDPAGKAGVTDLVTEMLDKGAGGKSAVEFSNALDMIGASFSAAASVEDTIVSISSTQENFPAALSLYADALVRPNFDQAEWDRVKQLHLDDLRQGLDEPATVARRVAAMEYFGSTHPYGHPVSGTLKTIESASLEDVRSMYRSYYQPSDATIFAAGSMSADDLKTQLEKAIGGWTSSGAVPSKPKYIEPTKKAMRVYVVDKPGAVQTVVRFIMPSPTGRDPHRIALEAIASLFGGTFTSRLNQNLRESKGYTYGAFAGYALQPSVGYFAAGADVRTNVTGASLKEFLSEFAKIRKGDISAEEVGKTRASMRTELVAETTTLGSLIGTAISMQEIGRSYVDLGQDLTQISALTPAQLNALVKASIPLENGVLVLVGDKAQILSQLKGLGLPTPVVVNAE